MPGRLSIMTVFVPKPNRWHPVMLPDDYIGKMTQEMEEVEERVEAGGMYG